MCTTQIFIIVKITVDNNAPVCQGEHQFFLTPNSIIQAFLEFNDMLFNEIVIMLDNNDSKEDPYDFIIDYVNITKISLRFN